MSKVMVSEWQQAIDEGAVPVEEFFDELRRLVSEHYDNIRDMAHGKLLDDAAK